MCDGLTAMAWLFGKRPLSLFGMDDPHFFKNCTRHKLILYSCERITKILDITIPRRRVAKVARQQSCLDSESIRGTHHRHINHNIVAQCPAP